MLSGRARPLHPEHGSTKQCVAIQDVGADRQEFRLGLSTSLLLAKGHTALSFPSDELLSGQAPREYDSAGAAVRYDITAITSDFPSEFIAPGAGAYDMPSKIVVAIMRRQDVAAYLGKLDAKDASRASLCLNDCLTEGNQLRTGDAIELQAALGGYGIVIENRGALGVSADIGVHVQLRGWIQMMTARKPCGDIGDDNDGHGTHVVGVAAGAAFTPARFKSDERAAAAHDGVAPAAKVYVHDVKQNGDVACNLAQGAGGVCNKVDKFTPPLNLKRDLLDKAHSIGARVHLAAWGCKVEHGEPADACNFYSAQAADIDRFMYEHPESLVITAVGDAGERAAAATIASPATNKNGLSVGASETWNEAYVTGVLERDPMEDICPCTFPEECSKSERINGVVASDSTRDLLMAQLHACCQDQIQAEHVLADAEIPSKQMWTYVVPDLGFFDADIQTYVRDKFDWKSRGASIEYDYRASSESLATPSYAVSDPLIQVMVFARRDFFEYFESGQTWCTDQIKAAGQSCRPNPCLTDAAKQADGSETCMSKINLIGGANYEKQACKPQAFGGKEFADVHCHNGECLNDPKPGQSWSSCASSVSFLLCPCPRTLCLSLAVPMPENALSLTGCARGREPLPLHAPSDAIAGQVTRHGARTRRTGAT